MESRLAQQAAEVAQHVRQQALGDDTAGSMPLPGDINGHKQELLACTAAARHASSVKVCIGLSTHVTMSGHSLSEWDTHLHLHA